MTGEPRERHDDAALSLGDAVVAAGPIALAVAAAAYLIARLGRVLRRP